MHVNILNPLTLQTPNVNTVFYTGLGNGLLCDRGVFWNLCALGQVSALKRAAGFPLLIFNAFCSLLLLKDHSAFLMAFLSLSNSQPLSLTFTFMSAFSNHLNNCIKGRFSFSALLAHAHTPTQTRIYIKGRGFITTCAVWGWRNVYTMSRWSSSDPCCEICSSNMFYYPAFSHNKHEHVQLPVV